MDLMHGDKKIYPVFMVHSIHYESPVIGLWPESEQKKRLTR